VFYALSVLVLVSPIVLAVVLTSRLSRRTKTLILVIYGLFLIVVPVLAVALGVNAGV
jgi:hypothetical protein